MNLALEIPFERFLLAVQSDGSVDVGLQAKAVSN
jgi:hypothetical protein